MYPEIELKKRDASDLESLYPRSFLCNDSLLAVECSESFDMALQ